MLAACLAARFMPCSESGCSDSPIVAVEVKGEATAVELETIAKAAASVGLNGTGEKAEAAVEASKEAKPLP